MPSSLVIHGHFYQPPRENPWTEVVEPEPSAAPFHDWNERIYQECYRANSSARISSPAGVVQSILNNYLNLSFNFGPTLLSWMEKEHPHGYQRILEADRESAKAKSGHGNAIAQAYNHCILPLCNERDRVTQVRWGLKEFKYRFGRDSESIWLPETACNDAVLGTLIDEKLRFVILAPSQCYRVRPLGAHDWQLKENADVDPGRAYRYFHKDGSGRSIALFFYDGPIARAIAFGEGLGSSQELLGVIGRAGRGEDRIISVATDGESYGHHTKWGDRTLAYALTHEAKIQDYAITNYAEYLDRFPPTWEAEVKAGPGGEGTAWSCAHGVGRWIRNCGCSTGGDAHWNQEWRGPLRKALDLLRDYGIQCFEKGSKGLWKDPWAARNEFIQIVLDPSQDNRRRFLQAHAAAELSPAQSVKALALLDMQRQAMLMYTSCGWFFTEISGIETLQVLKYACRLMDDLSELGFDPPRREFLEILGQAKSNLPSLGSGADIFRKLVEPSKVGMDRLAAHLAIRSLVEDLSEGDLGAYRYRFEGFQREDLSKTRLCTGRLQLESRISGRSYDAMFAATHLGGIDFHCCVARFDGEEALAESARRVSAEFRRGLIPPLLRVMREEFGVREFGLENLMPGDRNRIASLVFGGIIQNLSNEYSRLYEENRRYLEMFQSAGFSLPSELRTAAEYTLSRQFEEEIKAQRRTHDPEAYAKAVQLAREAERLGYHIERGLANQLFGEMITDDVRLSMTNPDSSNLKRAISLIELTQKLGIQPNLDKAQEFAVRANDQLHEPEELKRLAELLRLAPELLVHPPSPVLSKEA
jgi:alpha-amylase/alpha-mannosidase (GH57 family)